MVKEYVHNFLEQLAFDDAAELVTKVLIYHNDFVLTEPYRSLKYQVETGIEALKWNRLLHFLNSHTSSAISKTIA